MKSTLHNARSQFDSIYNSLVAGQRSVTLHNMALIEPFLADFIDYLAEDLNQPETALKAAKLWFNRNNESWS